jgi:hypothetical protein
MADLIDLMDAEYAMPGELEVLTPPHRRIEAWPDKAKRQIESLERRVRHLEVLIHRLVNASGGAHGDES